MYHFDDPFLSLFPYPPTHSLAGFTHTCKWYEPPAASSQRNTGGSTHSTDLGAHPLASHIHMSLFDDPFLSLFPCPPTHSLAGFTHTCKWYEPPAASSQRNTGGSTHSTDLGAHPILLTYTCHYSMTHFSHSSSTPPLILSGFTHTGKWYEPPAASSQRNTGGSTHSTDLGAHPILLTYTCHYSMTHFSHSSSTPPLILSQGLHTHASGTSPPQRALNETRVGRHTQPI